MLGPLRVTGLDDPSGVRSIGGKAAGLRRLLQAGLPVPDTRVVHAGALDAFLLHNQLTAPTAAEVANGAFPPGWEQALVDEARALGARLAVRSSGVEEDGSTRSFAGVHHTALGVSPERVPAAIRDVWASAFDTTARSYGPGSGMAVVLQPLLEPDAAGVVFTVNPQNGSWREVVVEAVRGQGEALVSGQAAPQYFVVRRPRNLPGRRVWNRLMLEVVQADAVPQDETWTLGTNGQLLRRPVPLAERSAPVLTTPGLLELCRLALRAEAHFGEPLDVEWARAGGRTVLLQARPITRTGTPRGRDVLWTRRFFGERWPTPPSPLSWSLLAPIIEWFIAYPDVQERFLGGGPAIRLIRGRPYLNATVFRHLLFKWPGAPAPGFMLELIPPDEVDEWRRRFRVKADWAVYNAIFADTWRERRWERFAFNPFTNHTVWEAYAARFDAEQAALDTPVLGRADAVQRVQAQQRLVRDYLSIHVCSLLFANLWYQVLQGCLASWAPGSTETWMEQLAVCPPGNKTLETNEALWHLAQVLGEPGVADLREGRTLEPSAAAALARFLAAYGHRAEASWEVFSPRWADHPERLVPLLQFSVEPRIRVGEQERTFADARRRLLAEVEGWRGRTLDGLVHVTRRYLLLRENQRFAFDRLLAGMQRTLLTLGAELGLDDPADIRWLTWDEVTGLAQGSFAGPLPIDERRRAHAAALADDPPIFLRGDVPADGELRGNRLTGLGVSAGRVRGRVRVLRTVADGEALQDGEILVTHAVDPGWTPLLLRAGGVVLELGSLLSHGAVVAREYGVPAVVNLSGITRVLRDGQEVTVDGSRGLVWVHA
ncbi:MAG: PEP/pyruvate-binding domain-containing protein [Myxococcota bacterium]